MTVKRPFGEGSALHELARKAAEAHGRQHGYVPEAGTPVETTLARSEQYRDRLDQDAANVRGRARARRELAPRAPRRERYTPVIPGKAVPYIERYAEKLRTLGQHDARPAEIPASMWVVGDLIGSSEEGAKAAITRLPDGLASLVVELFSRRVCPVRTHVVDGRVIPVYEKIDGKLRTVPMITDGDHSELVHDIRRSSDRKYIAGVALLVIGSHPSSRRGFDRVCSRFTAGTRAMCCTKADARRSPSGRRSLRYGREAWRRSGADHYGLPVGVNDWCRWALGELADVHQPPSSTVGPDERGPSGFAHYQWWFPTALCRGVWLPEARRYAQPREVRRFCGVRRLGVGEREGLRLRGILELDGDPLEAALADLTGVEAAEMGGKTQLFKGVLERSLAPPDG
jgi:hypothetical protein